MVLGRFLRFSVVPGWFFMVPGWFFMFFFMATGLVFMMPGEFVSSLMVPGWFNSELSAAGAK